jgi:hypothetical protein
MEITPTPEGFNATGVFCSTKPTAAGEKAPRERWRYGSQKLSAHQLYS